MNDFSWTCQRTTFSGKTATLKSEDTGEQRRCNQVLITWITEFEVRSIGIFLNDMQRETKNEIQKQNRTSKNCVTVSEHTTQIIGISAEEMKQKKYFKNSRKFPNLMTDTKLWILKSKRAQTRISSKRNLYLGISYRKCRKPKLKRKS